MAETKPKAAIEAARIGNDMAEAMFKAEVKITKSAVALMHAKEGAKLAKEVFEMAQAELQQLVKDARDGQGNLFAAKPDVQGKGTPIVPGTPITPEAWRAVELGSLHDPVIPPATLGKLAKADITTMGQLHDHSEKHPNRGIGTITGIGSGAEKKVSDATIAYWERNPQPAPAKADEPKKTDKPADGMLRPEQREVLEVIVHGKKATATKAIKACLDVDVLRAAKAFHLPGDWRGTAVDAQLKTVLVEPVADLVPEPTVDDLTHCSRGGLANRLLHSFDKGVVRNASLVVGNELWRTQMLLARYDTLSAAV